MPLSASVRTTVLLSGGLDSTALCVYYQELGLTLDPVFISYGQEANEGELRAAQLVSAELGRPLRVVDAGTLNPPQGYVFGRNAFLALAALVAMQPRAASILGIGIHGGTQYVDCSHSFVQTLQSLIDVYANGSVQLDAPFLSMTKADVARFLRRTRPELVGLTHSCQASGSVPCHRCNSCIDRENLLARQII